MLCLKSGPNLKVKSDTPIEESKNFGPVSSKLLREVGITTLEELKELGWQQAAFRISQQNPRFINLNMFRALIGACLALDWRNIPAKELAQARELLKVFKS